MVDFVGLVCSLSVVSSVGLIWRSRDDTFGGIQCSILLL